ncbi:hypothetical protein UFOVP411_11 [uncultured Caudovirales phage]|uniref:Major capsid protein Gp5 n=1 Tax=uncultured Caudovirales phage TaxID=2100421 RepID=A0A6J5M487_9CAUD|nr:hypothetical protein UFOVP411_11 [uncultured Caudovirales phage]
MPITSGAYGTAARAVTATTAAAFIPDMWSDEIVAAYKRALVMASNVRRITVAGKKGDVLNIPAPTRAQANQKAAGTLVQIQNDTESNVAVTINQHWEASRLIEDIVEVQALDSLRQFYTDDLGFALARQKDNALIQLGRSFNNGAGTAAYANAFIGGDGTTAYTSGTPNATALTAAGIRRTIQRMDDADLPMENRVFIIPPVARNTLMGIPDFTAQSFVGEVAAANTIRNGRIGNLYGVEVFVTPNADTATGAARICIMYHKDALVLVEQVGLRVQTQYKQEYLADLLTADTLYGVQNLRTGADVDVPSGGFVLAIPA